MAGVRSKGLGVGGWGLGAGGWGSGVGVDGLGIVTGNREIALQKTRRGLQQDSLGTSTPGYRGTSPIRKRTPLGPYRRPMPRVLRGP
jgi:hypothetical protein